MRPFPFTAVVGMADLRLALILSAVSPAIGGVLVRGEKGTAKSTMVRALAGLLPEVAVVGDCRFSCDPAEPDPACPDGPHPGEAHPGESLPGETHSGESLAGETEWRRRSARLVELPVGAAEDRVLGSLDLERALGEGVAGYQPGLLASAHRGLLYVDEVNLLHDHLVDVLLDAAAMGRATVEREGVSVSHAARFVLIGTMNPEEGELRPQLLDRFGLAVEVRTSHEPAERAAIVRRRMAYENDPESFADSYVDAEAELAKQIDEAMRMLPSVTIGDDALLRIAEVCASFQADGMRADIVIARTAIAHAAWSQRAEVTTEDIRVAARLALPHRRRRNPFDAPGVDESELDEALSQADHTEGSAGEGSAGGGSGGEPDGPGGGPEGPGGGAPPPETPPRPEQQEGEPHDGAPNTQQPGTPQPAPQHQGAGASPAGAEQDGSHPAGTGEASPSTAESTAEAGLPYRARLLSVAGSGTGELGRRSRAITEAGRTIGVAAAGETSRALHVPATVRAAAPHQHARGQTGPGLRLRPGDLRYARREGRESNLVLFCVDASGSMGARQRMREVKSAVLSLLLDAYQRRDKVGLVTFRGSGAQLALPATTSVDIAAARMANLPTGGRTPLAEGLGTAAETLRVEAIRDPRRRPLLVVVTDGRATSGPEPIARAHARADALAAREVASVVMDCESGRVRLGLAGELAAHLGAEHLALDEIAADGLAGEIKARTGGHGQAMGGAA